MTEITKVQRAELLARLKETALRPTRITSGMCIEGGVLPAKYDMGDQTLYVWGRCSRYSGGTVSVDDLAHAQDVVRRWHSECTDREGVA